MPYYAMEGNKIYDREGRCIGWFQGESDSPAGKHIERYRMVTWYRNFAKKTFLNKTPWLNKRKGRS